jgi:malto-oligosyltrehalose synthase
MEALIRGVRERLPGPLLVSATYRLQFHAAGTRFHAATELAGYLRQLGAGAVYASPLLKATRGSTHGYDVVDPTRLHDELGEPSEFEAFSDRLREHGLRLLLDIVPNHMSVAGDENAWWMDVLRHGPASRYAEFFDIDWRPVRDQLRHRVLLPILGDFSGKVLEAGGFQVHFRDGEFVLKLYEMHLPLDPHSWVGIMERELPEPRLPEPGELEAGALEAAPAEGLAARSSGEGDGWQSEGRAADNADWLELHSILAALRHLPPRSTTDDQEKAERSLQTLVITHRLKQLVERSAPVAAHIDNNLQRLNGRVGDRASFDELDALLDAQAYRLVHWKAGSDEINYRRFFDVTTLAALSVENLPVFETTHRLLLDWITRGIVAGVRVDHVDGLFDPTQYLWRLQWGVVRALGRRLCEEGWSEQLRSEDWDALEGSFLEAMHRELGGAAPRPLLDTGDLSGLLAADATSPATSAATAGADHPPLRLGQRTTERVDAGSETQAGMHARMRADLMERAAERAFERVSTRESQRETGQRETGQAHERGAAGMSAAGIFDASGASEQPLAAMCASPANTGLPEDLDAEVRQRQPLFVLVEKILGVDEPLPRNWPIAGTTGYEFLNELNGLFVHPRGLAEITRTYERFIGQSKPFPEAVYESKRLILSGAMQSEVQLLAHRFDRIAQRYRHSRDFTLHALRSAIREIIACFPVYRTYIRQGCVSHRDRQIVLRAVAQARRRNPATETSTFDFVRDVLLLEEPAELDAVGECERDALVGRFQQVTSPVTAKGVEDTAFYRHIPLLSLEEVGGEPERGARTLEEFHQQNRQRQQQWPLSMLATTTHDTKRSEDVRARINVLTEVPGLFRKAVQRWHRMNRKYLLEVDGEPAPSRNDEWLFYQTLIGMWPTESPDQDSRSELIRRLQQYMEKATHEAKLRTSWISPSEQYDAAVRGFVETVLAEPSGRFAADVEQFNRDIIQAGLLNAAAQVVLKLTSPGTPDIYQGQELWDFSLVDPDNRREVDYALRQQLLAGILSALQTAPARQQLIEQLRQSPCDPRFKLLVTHVALRFRQRLMATIAGAADGDGALSGTTDAALYVPLRVQGSCAEHVCALGWMVGKPSRRELCAVVAVPRWTLLLCQRSPVSNSQTGNPGAVWGDTRIELPGTVRGWVHSGFTGHRLRHSDAGALAVADLFQDFPVAIASCCADWDDFVLGH